MGIGLCLVYGLESYFLWGICEGLETGRHGLYLCWIKSESSQCETKSVWREGI